jgi:hypothetical protein
MSADGHSGMDGDDHKHDGELGQPADDQGTSGQRRHETAPSITRHCKRPTSRRHPRTAIRGTQRMARRHPRSGKRYRRKIAQADQGVNGRNLVDLLVASLSSSHARVTAGERNELRSLLEAMDMPTSPLSTLNVEG